MDSSCTVPEISLEFPLNIAIHVLILFCFLSLFYIFYVSDIERTNFNDEIKSLLNQGVSSGYDQLEGNDKTLVDYELSVLPLEKLSEYYSAPDEYVEEHNNMIFFTMIYVNITLFLLILFISLLLMYSCNQCISLKKILFENTLGFIVIGVIELLFFKNVGMKYVPVNPSTMTTTINDSLKNL